MNNTFKRSHLTVTKTKTDITIEDSVHFIPSRERKTRKFISTDTGNVQFRLLSPLRKIHLKISLNSHPTADQIRLNNRI
jgi:hypothetical protein